MASGAVSFAAINGSAGLLVAVCGYYGDPAPTILAGVAYGTEASGVRRARTAEFSKADALVLSDGSGNDRFPIRAGTDAGDVEQQIGRETCRDRVCQYVLLRWVAVSLKKKTIC